MSEDRSSRKRRNRTERSSPKAKHMKLTKGKAGNASPGASSLYAKSYLRVSKDSLYMIIALWMEDFVKKAPEGYNKVGAVLVLPNDIVWAVDCSRDGVHAVARLLMKHSDKAKGCKMFLSRKPCPMCAKLLVQSKVERVLFLPFEPEYYRTLEQFKPNAKKKTRKKTNKERKKYNTTRMKQVDMLFTASPIAQTRFVLKLETPVLRDAKLKTPTPLKEKKEQIRKEKRRLVKKYGFEKSPKWLKVIEKNLPWPAFDNDIQAEVEEYFENAMEWMARAKVLPERELNFERVSDNGGGGGGGDDRGDGGDDRGDDDGGGDDRGDGGNDKGDDGGCGGDGMGDDDGGGGHDGGGSCDDRGDDDDDDDDDGDDDAFDPVNTHANQARHFMMIARFLAERTDDPKTGVGAVIVSPEMEVISLGWNGFPLKALYAEFPRGSKDDNVEKKYPYVIHAEQNALLMRNKKKIKGTILFVTKTPCNECTPLITMQGIKTVVVDDDVLPCNKTSTEGQVDDKAKEQVDEKAQEKGLSYKMFPDKVKKGKFICYQTKKKPIDAAISKVKQKLADQFEKANN